MQESTHEWGGVEGLGKGQRGWEDEPLFGGASSLGGVVPLHKEGWGGWVYGLGNGRP